MNSSQNDLSDEAIALFQHTLRPYGPIKFLNEIKEFAFKATALTGNVNKLEYGSTDLAILDLRRKL